MSEVARWDYALITFDMLGKAEMEKGLPAFLILWRPLSSRKWVEYSMLCFSWGGNLLLVFIPLRNTKFFEKQLRAQS